MKANKNSLRHKPWLGSPLGKQKEDSRAFRTNILSQPVPLSNRQSPQQTSSAPLSTQRWTAGIYGAPSHTQGFFLLNFWTSKLVFLGATNHFRWRHPETRVEPSSAPWQRRPFAMMMIRGRARLKPQNIQSQTVHLSESLSMVLKLSSTPWNLKQRSKSLAMRSEHDSLKSNCPDLTDWLQIFHKNWIFFIFF